MFLEGQWRGWSARLVAWGLPAAVLLCAVGMYDVLRSGNPMENPGEFALAIVIAVGLGATGAMTARESEIRTLRSTVDLYRRELERMAKDKAVLEQSILKDRLSSQPRKAPDHPKRLS